MKQGSTNPGSVYWEIKVLNIRRAREQLKTARKFKCSCKGMTIQIQGCSCNKGEQILIAIDNLNTVLENT